MCPTTPIPSVAPELWSGYKRDLTPAMTILINASSSLSLSDRASGKPDTSRF